MKRIIKNIIYIVIIIISSFIFSLSYHLKKHFNATYLEQLLYNLLNTTTLKLSSLEHSYYKILFLTIIISCILFIPLFIRTNYKNIKIFPINLKKYSLIIFIISIFVVSIQIGLPNYIINQTNQTKIYDKYYIPYKKENITFNTKRNLIHIYIESLENSNFTTNNGGIQKTSYMPHLEKLTKENINFSNTNKIGGFKTLHGTNWTIAGMVAQTAGIPIYIKTTNKNDNFLNGATSLGDILSENGYNNYLMIGSDANFGERKKYFTEHGQYKIYDYEYARNNGDIPKNYKNWWGYEDRILFTIAKNKLLEISSKNIPFNYTILTADTHFFDGYVDESCELKFTDHYANSFHCEDKMLYEFITWIQKQDFYKNTTIIITGDHLAMRNDFYKTNNKYTRTVYNLFINPINNPKNTNNRDFTAFDIFPTTLSSIGANIKNDRLALGTNLFSNKKTISEEIGYKNFYKEIEKKSKYYNKYILK